MRLTLPCLLICCAVAASAGCDAEPPVAVGAEQPSPAASSAHFDPSSCGSITGLVTWVGPLPEVPPVLHVVPRPDGTGHDARHVPLGNAPQIDRVTRGVGAAVVYLREVDPRKAKPWDLPPVTVEFRDSQLVVKQGERVARAGFVRRGDSVQMQSAEPVFHSLRGRGAAFFSLAFPDPGKPLSRRFDDCGRIDLTSAAGFYWQSAQLFVCDHPYYAVTDDAGRYEFTNVPAGRYDLVAWHPNWHALRTERNPELCLPSRIIYAPPLESSRPATVTPARPTLANLTLPK